MATFGNRTCPECGADFSAKHHAATFCCPAHQQAFHNRSAKRGKVLLPLMQAAVLRSKADEDMATWARREAYNLVREWNREDKAAGRRPELVSKAKFEMGWIAADLGC